MQNNKAAGRQLPPRTKKTAPSRSFLQLESGQISLICNQIGAGRHPRSGQGFLPAPITPSFFLALFRGSTPKNPVEKREVIFSHRTRMCNSDTSGGTSPYADYLRHHQNSTIVPKSFQPSAAW